MSNRWTWRQNQRVDFFVLSPDAKEIIDAEFRVIEGPPREESKRSFIAKAAAWLRAKLSRP